MLSTIGTPDPNFADGGEYIAPVNPSGSTGLFNIYALDVQQDGKIDVGGLSGTFPTSTYGIIQFNVDGTLNTSFGQGGEATVAMPAGFYSITKLYAEQLQADGKIVVAGIMQNLAGTQESIVARFDPDGSPDKSFGIGGTTVLSTPGLALNYEAIEPDGQIVLAGSMPTPEGAFGNTETAVVRLDADGGIDPSFGNAGVVALTTVTPSERTSEAITEEATGVAISPDGKIVLYGDTLVPQDATHPTPQLTAELFRLNTDGSQDPSLSQSGVQAAKLAYADINGVIVQPDGKILLLGHTVLNYPHGDPVLARLNADGSLDGLAPLPHPNNGYVVNAFALQADGKIVLTGDQFSDKWFALRVNPDLSMDDTFGVDGESDFKIHNDVLPKAAAAEVVAIAPDGQIVLGGTSLFSTYLVVSRISGGDPTHPASGPVAPLPSTTTDGDYVSSGYAQPTLYIPSTGEYVIRSMGLGDAIVPFGLAGAGQTIPAPGDYDGSGRTELAAYLPSLGIFVYRPADGGPDVFQTFGIAGAGQTIPAPGDYDGDGHDDVAVYLPSLGAFAIRAPGIPDRIIPFGFAGAGQTIPAPGDYFGTGRADIAAYFPSLGAFIIRNPAGGPDAIIPFGLPGAGQSIPVPGDYDGSGKTELAVYLPSLGEFVYRPANGGPDVFESFGIPGQGQTIPAPGDYDGSGRDEFAAYFPSVGMFVYRPTDAPDVTLPFGIPGAG